MRGIYGVAFSGLFFVTSAAAQTPTDASKVDKAKPQETGAIPAEATPVFTQEGQGTLGGLFTTGNVDSAVARAGAMYQFKYLVHQLRFELGAGVASIAQDPDLDPSNGVGIPLFDERNQMNTQLNARLRYDFFLGDSDSLYAAGLFFHDSATNLLARLRADLGYRHLFLNDAKHSLSGEIGGVYTIDNVPFNGDTNGDGGIDLRDETNFEKSGGTFGARLAAAYANALNERVTFTTQLEVIPNIFPDVDAPYEAGNAAEGIPARVDANADNKLGFGEATIANSNTTLTYLLNTNLSIGANLVLIYDNGAITRRNAYTNHDAALSVQLGYKFF